MLHYTVYFLLEKQTFNKLLMVIGKQNLLKPFLITPALSNKVLNT